MAEPAPIQSLGDAMRWLDAVERAPAPRATGAWPLGAVLEHLAQSIDMSMDGYPVPKAEWFQRTAGAAAFAFFKWRGRMNHGLDEAIPGAPSLPAGADWRPGLQRLRAAIVRFDAHSGPLKPHFAYGPLTRPEYALAHAMHIANHAQEIRLG